jgi:phage tail sheath protein FI
MPEYLSPGVYVEEVPSLIKAIAGVSTSTAGFIGINSFSPVNNVTLTDKGDGTKTAFDLPKEYYSVQTAQGTFVFRVGGTPDPTANLSNNTLNSVSVYQVTFKTPPPKDSIITGDFQQKSDLLDQPLSPVKNVTLTDRGDGQKIVFDLPKEHYPVQTAQGTFVFRVDGTPDSTATLSNNTQNGVSQVTFKTPPKDKVVITGDYQRQFGPIEANKAKLCTNFSQFKKFFGDFSSNLGQRTLAHAVYGFFNNGGSRCYVAWIKEDTDLQKALDEFERIDEIALVLIPGKTDEATRDALVTHCHKTGDRFAILDGPNSAPDLNKLTDIAANSGLMPKKTDLAAWYFPGIKVFDPVTKFLDSNSDGLLEVPPSGHIAGIYARVDSERGVHKAPANEAILGALDVAQKISKAEQNGLNPKGVNCIRVLNDNILVWGARTVGGDENFDLKYVNVRRTLLYLRKSIDQGTQWVVFEPNAPDLWKRITRNVSDFLTVVWRSGALFGTTPQQAFYVKCDAETNPPEERELGRVITEIGVAIVRPAEFVIFRISQFTATTS